MADYSGYTPRQQQRQDPWADAAVGIAKLFMPDQETQLRAGQLEQQRQLNDIRIKSAEAEGKAADARAIYDADRISEANAQRGFQDEHAKILSEVARNGGKMTSSQASRIAYLTSRMKGGALSPEDMGRLFELTPEGREAKRKRDEADAEAKKNAQAAEAEKKEQERIRMVKEKLDDADFRAEAKRVKEYEPPKDDDLKNAIIAEVYRITQGNRINDEDINLIIRTARAKKLRGSAEEIASAAVQQALGADAATAATRLDPAYPQAEIDKLMRDDPAGARARSRERRFRKEGFDAIANLKEASPNAIVIEGTPEEIVAEIKARGLPPGTPVIFRNTATGLYGGGMVPPPAFSVTHGYQAIPRQQQVIGYLAPWKR